MTCALCMLGACSEHAAPAVACPSHTLIGVKARLDDGTAHACCSRWLVELVEAGSPVFVPVALEMQRLRGLTRGDSLRVLAGDACDELYRGGGRDRNRTVDADHLVRGAAYALLAVEEATS